MTAGLKLAVAEGCISRRGAIRKQFRSNSRWRTSAAHRATTDGAERCVTSLSRTLLKNFQDKRHFWHLSYHRDNTGSLPSSFVTANIVAYFRSRALVVAASQRRRTVQGGWVLFNKITHTLVLVLAVIVLSCIAFVRPPRQDKAMRSKCRSSVSVSDCIQVSRATRNGDNRSFRFTGVNSRDASRICRAIGVRISSPAIIEKEQRKNWRGKERYRPLREMRKYKHRNTIIAEWGEEGSY